MPNEKRVGETGVHYPIKTYKEKDAMEMVETFRELQKPPHTVTATPAKLYSTFFIKFYLWLRNVLLYISLFFPNYAEILFFVFSRWRISRSKNSVIWCLEVMCALGLSATDITNLLNKQQI